jgi:CheY-like chemotaxis protein
MSCHFLIIDDDPVDRLIVKRIASKLDADIATHEAESVDQGIAVCRQHPIAMVLIDLRLVMTKGIETVESFRERVPDVPLFVTSGVPLQQLPEVKERFSIRDFVIKSEISREVIEDWIQGVNELLGPTSIESVDQAIEVSIEMIEDAKGGRVDCVEQTSKSDQGQNRTPAASPQDASCQWDQPDAMNCPSSKFVMIADDEESDLLILSRQLSAASDGTVRIQKLDSGIDAIDALLNLANSETLNLPDVVFLDLNMPQKDGYQTLLEIRSDERLKNLPVVIYSTSISESDTRLSRLDDATQLMEKPFGRAERIQQVKLLREKWFAVS